MAIALVLTRWRPEIWAEAVRKLAPECDIRIYSDALGELSQIDYALVWRPEPGALSRFPNLKVIFSLGAGVNHLMKDPALPGVPIARFADPDMTMRMSEYVVQHVLMHHRQQRRMDRAQA